MSDKTNSTVPSEPEGDKAVQVDESRRRLTKAGVVGSGVILTLASRSVLGGWGICTGSEIMSGNLSKPGEANPCGCSPGYWGNNNGKETWLDQLGKLISSSHGPDARFNATFGRVFFDPGATLWTAVKKAGTVSSTVCGSNGHKETVAFHAVAALLNASVYGARYPVPGYQSAASVISKFQAAYDAGPLGSQAQCAGLNAFVAAVDIYDSNETWCFGDQHTNTSP